MSAPVVFLTALAIGFAAGLRAFTPLALVSWLAIWGWTPLAGSPFWFIGTTKCAVILSVLALGELIGDKLPKTPARIQAGPLIAREIAGAISAAALSIAAGRHWLFGIGPGALGALSGTFCGYHARRWIVQKLRLPDFIVALIEDFITVVGTLCLVRFFFSTPL